MTKYEFFESITGEKYISDKMTDYVLYKMSEKKKTGSSLSFWQYFYMQYLKDFDRLN